MSDVPEISGFDFSDLAPQQRQVRFDGKDYVLREASAEAARQWRNANVRSAKMVDGKLSAMGDIADGETLLLSLCLFPYDSPKPVSLAIIRTWPNRVIRPLYDWIVKNSALNEKPNGEDEGTKKSPTPGQSQPSPTTDTSV